MCDNQTAEICKYSISINYLADTVRVHKKSIDVLGTPRFIQFMINPDAKVLYMKGTNTRSLNCIDVPSAEFRKRNQYTLHGRYFIKKLSELAGWSLEYPLVIYGDYDAEYNLIVFKLDEALIVSKKPEEEKPQSVFE